MELHECSQMDQAQRREMIGQIRIAKPKKVRQCDHVKTNGEFCGSPALRGRNYCYFHLTYIGRRLRAGRVHAQAKATSPETAEVPLELPPFEDANSIQMALMQVVDAILHGRIDSKRAGLVLYALQTASSNLARGADFEHMQGATVAARYDDFEEDFELGDDAPELQAEESAEEEADEHAAEIARIEEMAEAYAKVDAAEAAAQARREADPNYDPDEDLSLQPGYPCGWMNQFVCSLQGPLSRAQAGGAAPVRKIEREAGSQRLELVASLSRGPGEEDNEVSEERAA